MPNATCLPVLGGCRGRLIGYPERLARVARARRLEKVLRVAAAEMPRAGKRVGVPCFCCSLWGLLLVFPREKLWETYPWSWFQGLSVALAHIVGRGNLRAAMVMVISTGKPSAGSGFAGLRRA